MSTKREWAREEWEIKKKWKREKRQREIAYREERERRQQGRGSETKNQKGRNTWRKVRSVDTLSVLTGQCYMNLWCYRWRWCKLWRKYLLSIRFAFWCILFIVFVPLSGPHFFSLIFSNLFFVHTEEKDQSNSPFVLFFLIFS